MSTWRWEFVPWSYVWVAAGRLRLQVSREPVPHPADLSPSLMRVLFRTRHAILVWVRS